MSTDSTEKKPVISEGDPKWLLQFYSAGKSTDPDESGVPQPLSEIAIPPAEKYRVEGELGSGGMKSVLRTFERATERNVAMAVLRDPSASRRKMTRFVREARITAALEHPNIVPIYEIGLDATGKPYFTMKLLGGESLQSILQRIHAGYGDYRKRYPLNSLLQVFRGVCNAISFAHSRGVVHLDLKPANIQVGDFGDVLVLDWGLARVLEKDPVLFPNRLILDKSLQEYPSEGVSGTPKFMSPEQSRGENDALDERTDIYSLGAILYAILNCRKPSGKPDRRTRQENVKIPPALEAVATKAMSEDPDHRYETVEELACDVRAYVEGFATEAQHAGALTLLWLLIKRHHVVAALTTVGLAAVIAILVTAFVKIRHSEQLAIDTLEKFKAEEAGKYKLGLLAAPQLIQQANDAKYLLDHDKALSLLNQTITLDTKNVDAWWDIAAIHLGRWEFDQTADALTHVPKPDFTDNNTHPVDMQGILEKYSKIPAGLSGDTLRKTQEDFVHDLIDADHNSWPNRRLALAVFFQIKNSNPKTVDYGLIEKALRWLNPEAKNLVFTHEDTPEGLKVGLHSDKDMEICALAGLPISILDLSDTGRVGLEWLRNAPLTSVDFSRSATGDVRMLDQWPNIHEIRLIDWRDKDYTRLGNFRHLQRVIVPAADVNYTNDVLRTMPVPPQVIGQ
ncbi:MAG: serine/threonine-protein kinase [Chthoniobacterales bacterium]